MCAIPYMSLDLTPGHGNLLGESYWEILSPWRSGLWTLNTGVSPREGRASSLSQILEDSPPRKYYLSRKACLGILRRARERGKPLPPQLEAALKAQAGLTVYLTPVQNPPQPSVTAFAQNQRDEVRDLHDVAGALSAQPGMKQQTFVAGFCAGAGPSAGSIGYQKEVAPTLKAVESGTNMVPSVLCLNDQGGSVMDCTEDISGTLRAQEHGHQPLVFENNGNDCRYRGPLPIVPTLTARGGSGGNNLPLVEMFSRQRVDLFLPNDVASTESARQHKDATDLIYQETVGALTTSDSKGPNSQYVSQDKLVVEGPLLIRRLTPRECERLQGFPDDWTSLPGAADAPRYKALGNSVAIPCVEYLMRGMACVLRAEEQRAG